MSYKKIIDTFLTKRYNYLMECSTNILKYNTIVEPTELVGELALYLYTNKPKIEEYLAIDKLEAFCVSWMTINGKYNTSPVNRKHSQREYEIDETYDVVCNDVGFDNHIGMDEYEKDLSNIFNEDQIKKILSMDKVIDKLTKSELILFKAYFVENLSYDKICKKYTFYREKDGKKITYKSKKSIYTLMNGLKNKIRENI
jgi:hypothetical protein